MEGEEREREEKGFVVRDKRHHFQEEGKQPPDREGKVEKPEADEPTLKAEEREKEAGGREEREPRKGEGRQDETRQISPPPDATFSVIVSLLAAQPLTILSELPKLDKAEKDIHLQWARHFIDLMGILKEKTKENLEEDERASIDNALTHLKMMYVKVSG